MSETTPKRPPDEPTPGKPTPGFNWRGVRNVVVLLLALYALNRLDRQLRPPPPPQDIQSQTLALTDWRTAFYSPPPPPAWIADDSPICKVVRCHPPPPDEARCWKPARFESGQPVWLHVCR